MNKFIVITVITILTGTLRQCQANNNVDEIIGLKNTVESVSSDFKIWSANFVSNQRSNLRNLKNSEFENLNITVKEAYDDSRTNIDAAKKRGKNADHCSETMERQLSDAQRTASDKMDECANDGFAYLEKLESFMDGYITSGKSLLSDLDGIQTSCISLNQTEKEECITQQMVVARASVDRYKELIKELSTGDSSAASESIPAHHCFKLPMPDFESAISAAKTSTDACIQNS